jgi:UDP-2-acetamido-2,6-beta-L-arabino-hexul-4-ose reductase
VLADGGIPRVDADRELDLLHATDAAALLLGVDVPDPRGGAHPAVRRTVLQIADQLSHFAAVYRSGEIPQLTDHFDVRLFNTYRSHCFPANSPLRLTRHTDARGSLVEAVKVHGGGGQTFCSSTVPGVTRGEHFHLAKVERFVVVRGEAEICLRRVLHDDVVRFRLSSDEPAVVDMPTMWAHNITNVGDGELMTLFWANDLFDPARPDTYPEPVG